MTLPPLHAIIICNFNQMETGWAQKPEERSNGDSPFFDKFMLKHKGMNKVNPNFSEKVRSLTAQLLYFITPDQCNPEP